MKPSGLKTNQKFLKTKRLVKPEQYKNLFNKPKRSSDNCFIILAKKNKYTYPRLGLAISKKNIKLSVQRNRIKRLIREYFRKEVNSQKKLKENINSSNKQQGIDFVVMSKKNINLKDNKKLRASLAYNFNKLLNLLSS